MNKNITEITTVRLAMDHLQTLYTVKNELLNRMSILNQERERPRLAETADIESTREKQEEQDLINFGMMIETVIEDYLTKLIKQGL